MELTLNSVIGLTTQGTMKVKSTVNRWVVVTLIDCTIHNFISQRLVEQLGLKTSETGNYDLVLGSGEAKRGKGICKVLVFNLPNMTVQF